MVFAGTDGMVAAWKPAAEQIFGFTAEEAIGQSLDVIIPERFRPAHWGAYDRALETGKTKSDGTPTMTQAKKYLHQITRPTLVLTAEDDPFISSSIYQQLAWPSSVAIRIEKEGRALGLYSESSDAILELDG